MTTFTHTLGTWAAVAALTATLLGCGGSAAQPPAPSVAPVVNDNSGARGSLVQSPPPRVRSFNVPGVTAYLGQFGTLMLISAGTPKCGVDVHQFEYGTVGAAGEATMASAALMVPTGTNPACSGKHPIVLYGHGSSMQRRLNMAETVDLTNEGAGRASTPMALFAAQGYIVVAPNYAGYDTSTLPYHPHHIADQQAKDMIDALTAARKALPSLPNPAADNGKLFLTGYSEGGYVTMATHRAMQAAA